MAKKILLVDDEDDLVKSVRRRLEANSYEVAVACDGLEALEAARVNVYDLVILDIMLPKMDGLEVCALLKKDARYFGTPIIIFSARSSEADRQMASDAGADAYIVKPFDKSVLMAKVHQLLGE
ncbi:MAG: response regulator [Candidatus Omnitrophota bacterium]